MNLKGERVASDMQRELGNILLLEAKDEDFKKALGKFLDITLKDNMKAWQLTGDTFTKVVKSDDEEAVNSQEYFMNNRLI